MKLQIDLKKNVIRYEGNREVAFKYIKKILPLNYSTVLFKEDIDYNAWNNLLFVKFIKGESNFYHTMDSGVQIGANTREASTFYKKELYNIQIVKND